MEKIEFTTEVKIGDKVIDEINVKPINFVTMVGILASIRGTPANSLDREEQRARIKHQTHFMSGGERVIPEPEHLTTLPVTVGRDIVNALYIGTGSTGEIIASGDGISEPIVYKLATPIEMKQGSKTVSFSEIEFIAKTFGDVEDVLAASDVAKRAELLLRNIAKPVGVEGLNNMPAWAIDKITWGDGLGICNQVATRF